MTTAIPISRRRVRWVFWSVFLASALLISAYGIWNHPANQERRLHQMPLKALLSQISGHEYDALWLYYTGLRLNEAQRFQESLPILRRGAQLQPDSARIRSEWTRAQLAEGRFAEALSQLQQFADTNPRSAEAHLLLGRFHLSTGNGKRALEELKQAVVLSPNDAEAWAALASARTQFTSQTDEALAAAEKADALNPTDPENLLQLAYLYTKVGHPRTREIYERAYRAAPDRADTLRQFADYLFRSSSHPEDVARAAEMSERAIRLEPEAPLGYLVLGRARMKQQRWQEALAPLQKAASLQPNSPPPAALLAETYRALHGEKEAKQWQAKYLALQQFSARREMLHAQLSMRPEDRSLLAQMARLLGEHGEATESLRYRAQAMHRTQDDPETLEAVAKDLRSGGYVEAATLLLKRASERQQGP